MEKLFPFMIKTFSKEKRLHRTLTQKPNEIQNIINHQHFLKPGMRLCSPPLGKQHARHFVPFPFEDREGGKEPG